MDATFYLGDAIKRMGKSDESLPYFEQALEMSKRLNNPIVQLDCYHKIALVFRYQEKHYLAVDQLKEAAALASLMHDKDDEARCHAQMASDYNMADEPELALSHVHESIRLYDSLKDGNGVISGYNLVAIIYGKQKDYIKALKYFKAVDSMNLAAHDTDAARSSVVNTAITYKNLGNFDKAIEIYHSVFGNDTWINMHIHSNLGAALAGKGNFAEAKKHFLKAEEINRQDHQYTFLDIENYRELAISELKAHHPDSALRYGLLCEKTCRETNTKNDTYLDCLALLSDIYAAKGNYTNALEYSKKRSSLVDTLSRISRARNFAEAEARFRISEKNRDLDKLAKENELEKVKSQRLAMFLGLGGLVVVIGAGGYRRSIRKNAQLRKQRQIIDEQLSQLAMASEMKSKFYANVSHELRTPVTLLSGMLELMKNEGGDKGTAKLDIAFNNSRKLQFMIEEILDLSRLEKSETVLKKQTVAVAPLLKRITYAFESFIQKRGLELKYSDDGVADVFISVDENKFEKIINNLIYNAIKFNSEHGSLTITAYTAK